MHSYDLLLRWPPSGPDLALAALRERGAVIDAEGRGSWRLDAGEVALAPLIDEGQWQGVDVQVPLQESTALLEAVAQQLVEVAHASAAPCIDPQRNEVVSLASASSMVEAYLRLGRYAGEYGGQSAAIGLSTLAQSADEDSGSFRGMLVFAVFLLALYAGWRTVTATQAVNQATRSARPDAG